MEAFFAEFRENDTIWVSHPEVLPKLVLKKPAPALQVSNLLDFAFFRAIQLLRQRPERIERPRTWPTPTETTIAGTHAVADIRGLRISSMDGYVLAREDGRTRRMYRSTVLKLFIADRVALGMVPLVDVVWLICRGRLAWEFSYVVRKMVTQASI